MWTDPQRKLIDAILAEIIPPSADGRVPSAGGLGVGEFLHKSIASDPAAAVLFNRVIALAETLAGDGLTVDPQLVARIEAGDPEAFTAILRLTYMGYYSRADVRPLFGLSALPVHPQGYDVPPETPELLEELTGPVKARGASYRDC